MARRSSSSRLRIVVTGILGSVPLAGLTLHYLQYVLGLRQLGHDCLYLEDTGCWTYDPATDGLVPESEGAAARIAEVLGGHGFADRWAFLDWRGRLWGFDRAGLDDFLGSADVLLNVSGTTPLRDEYMRIPVRAYVDTDPGFVQARAARGVERDLDHLRSHDVHFTFGCNIGAGFCSIPTAGIDWLPTVQPVVLPLWPDSAGPAAEAPMTTVVKWRTYDVEEHEGRPLGMKDEELRRFLALPGRTGRAFEIASTGPPPAELDLAGHGWRLRSGLEVSSSVESYGSYIRGSRAEWSVAKGAYVTSRSGWFSERSACYLASGRPVIVQDTGFTDWLAAGEGVLSFRTLEEAAAAVEDVDRRYERHCAAAREVAESRFEAGTVLARLLEDAHPGGRSAGRPADRRS